MAESESIELRLKVDRKFLEDLQERVHASKPTEVIRWALGVYDWATEEVSEGRTVLSLDKSGSDPERLHAPEFSTIKKSAA